MAEDRGLRMEDGIAGFAILYPPFSILGEPEYESCTAAKDMMT
jgi:hypothetical protein